MLSESLDRFLIFWYDAVGNSSAERFPSAEGIFVEAGSRRRPFT